LSSEPEETWDFDTIRTNPYAPNTHQPVKHKNGPLDPPGLSSDSTNRVLQNLTLDSELNSKNGSPRGRNVSGTAIKLNGAIRQSTNISSTEDQSRDVCECDKELQDITPEIDYGRAGSTVRLFRRVSDTTPRNLSYGTVQGEDRPSQIGNKAPVIIPSTEEGFLGRQVHFSVIQPVIAEVN
jgi:serine/threonine-protein kinase 24/25/MST4